MRSRPQVAGDWVASMLKRWSASMNATSGLRRILSSAAAGSLAEKPLSTLPKLSRTLPPLFLATERAPFSDAAVTRSLSTTM